MTYTPGGQYVVSVSDNTRVSYGKRGWRVRCFFMPADMNRLGYTLSETWHRTRSAAIKYAGERAESLGATLQGAEG